MAYFSIFAKGSDLSDIVDTAVSHGVIDSTDCLFDDSKQADEAVAEVRVALALCFRVACFDSEDELFGFVRGMDSYLDPMESKMKALRELASGNCEPINAFFQSSEEEKGYRDIVFLKNLEQQTITDVLSIIRRYTGTHISYNGNNFISMETGFMPIKFSGGEYQ